MAWDALASRFQKKRTEEDKSMGAQAQPSTSGGGFSGGAPVSDPTGGFGGNAGSTSGGPVSAGFVNYAELYGANEEKAKAMASNAYRGAEKKAEGAKDALQTARDQFAGAVGAGTGKGPGGTQIDSDASRAGTAGGAQAPGQQGSTFKPSRARGHKFMSPNQTFSLNPGSAPITAGAFGGALDAAEVAQANVRRANTAGAKRYEDLYGPATGVVASDNPDLNGLHLSSSVLDAKSGAGQDYTGPNSLKDQLGEEGYSALGEKLREGEEAVAGLQDAGGIMEALGYAPGSETGNAAMDAGLTQTAGQAAFKKLKERYGGLGQSLVDAQIDSEKAAKGAGIITDVAAKDWQDMLDAYEKEQKGEPPPGAIVLPAAQGETTGDRIGVAAGQTTNTDGGVLSEGGNTPGVQKVTEAGYDQQDVNDVWDSLTKEEQYFLKLTGGWNNEFQDPAAYHTLLQSILAKIAAMKARKSMKGGS